MLLLGLIGLVVVFFVLPWCFRSWAKSINGIGRGLNGIAKGLDGLAAKQRERDAKGREWLLRQIAERKKKA